MPKPPVNYLEREARNSALGRAGELFVVKYERARLIDIGKRAFRTPLAGDAADRQYDAEKAGETELVSNAV